MNTLTDFLLQHPQQNALPAELGNVLESIIAVCVQTNGKICLGALFGALGMAGTGSIQDEDQKRLDVITSETLIETLKQNPNVAELASEEKDAFVSTDEDGGYLVLFDPLDGSSNIDINISVGTIFPILNKPAGRLNTESFPQKGNSQMSSGCALYGPRTQPVFTLKHGVFISTLNGHGGSVLTQENPQVLASTQEFAINISNQRHWFPPMQQYIAELLEGNTGVHGKNCNMRWVASMVAEIRHILMHGGVFMYPQDKRDPAKSGKLRPMCEANPMSLILKQAGGASSNALEIMLDIQPIGLHQHVAVVVDSREEMEYIGKLHLG